MSKGDSPEPSREYIQDYEHNPTWNLLGEQQDRIAREREERLHGEIINED